MTLKLRGAKTLMAFTQLLQSTEFSLDGELIQVHASPLSIDEDLAILRDWKSFHSHRKILLHRPDELLLYPELVQFFKDHPLEELVLFGDEAFRYPFWRERKGFCTIAPHPCMSLQPPELDQGHLVVGSYTTWGEMRKLEHFVELVEKLKHLPLCFKIGGTLNGSPLPLLPGIEIASEFFVPHFNVQLYHLNGRKRYCESSGSLHRGVSIPVIFEANGIERIEGLQVVKIFADDELSHVDYASAANEIERLTSGSWERVLADNLQRSRRNTPAKFLATVVPDE